MLTKSPRERLIEHVTDFRQPIVSPQGRSSMYGANGSVIVSARCCSRRCGRIKRLKGYSKNEINFHYCRRSVLQSHDKVQLCTNTMIYDCTFFFASLVALIWSFNAAYSSSDRCSVSRYLGKTKIARGTRVSTTGRRSLIIVMHVASHPHGIEGTTQYSTRNPRIK